MKGMKTLLIVFLGCVVVGPILGIAVMATPSLIMSGLGFEFRSTSDIYTRQEFVELLRYKSPNEVIELIGRPERVRNQWGSIEDDSYWADWTYYNKTKDPIAKKNDSTVIIGFAASRAVDFSF